MLELHEQKKLQIYLLHCIASRFIDELPEENLKKNNYFKEDQIDDFEFNQDVEFESEIQSPGWKRYQKKLKSNQ